MNLILLLPVLLFSIVVHEWAHAYVALRQGDTTAYRLGRVTLNPLPHIDLFGSILVPMVLLLSQSGFLFGWAKPVPVDARNFRDFRRGDILVSLAGIASNLALVVVFTGVMVVLAILVKPLPNLAEPIGILQQMARFGVIINLILAFFNLLPIPPLDGSHVVFHMLPAPLAHRYREFGRFGILVLFGILFFAPGLLSSLLRPVWFIEGLTRSLVGLFS